MLIESRVFLDSFTLAWEQRKLGELSSSFEYGLNAAAKEYDGENKYIRITDIDDESREFKQEDITSPDTDLSSAENYKLSEGDILFARTGASVGKSYIYKASDGLVYYAGFLIRARIKPEYNSEFVFQNTLTGNYEKFIKVTSMRLGQPGVNAQEYSQYQIMMPSKSEQDKISDCLRNLDNLITLHQCKCNYLIRLKHWIFYLLNKTDWEQRKLSELVDRVVRKNINNESTLPLTISAQYGLVDQITYFNNRVASRDVSNYYLVLNGEFAYNKSTSDGFPFGAVKRLDLYEKGVLSTLYIVFALKNSSETNSDFITVFFDTDRWHKGVSERATEGARNHGLLNISAEDFFDIDLRIPKSEIEQGLIGKYFEHLDHLITLHQRKPFCINRRQKWKQTIKMRNCSANIMQNGFQYIRKGR